MGICPKCENYKQRLDQVLTMLVEVRVFILAHCANQTEKPCGRCPYCVIGDFISDVYQETGTDPGNGGDPT